MVYISENSNNKQISWLLVKYHIGFSLQFYEEGTDLLQISDIVYIFILFYNCWQNVTF